MLNDIRLRIDRSHGRTYREKRYRMVHAPQLHGKSGCRTVYYRSSKKKATPSSSRYSTGKGVASLLWIALLLILELCMEMYSNFGA